MWHRGVCTEAELNPTTVTGRRRCDMRSRAFSHATRDMCRIWIKIMQVLPHPRRSRPRWLVTVSRGPFIRKTAAEAPAKVGIHDL